MLHEVVNAVKTGACSTTAGSDCSGVKQPGRLFGRTVVIVGHSAGGWIVSGYPGTYDDVAAMIQTDITGSSAQGDGSDGGSTGGGFTPTRAPRLLPVLPDPPELRGLQRRPRRAVPSAVNVACTPPFLDSAYGEIADLGAMYAENDVAISQMGPVPRPAHVRRPRHDGPAVRRPRRPRLLPGPLRLRRLPDPPARHRPPVPGARLAAGLRSTTWRRGERTRSRGQARHEPVAQTSRRAPLRAAARAKAAIASTTASGCSRCGLCPPGTTRRLTGPRTRASMRSSCSRLPYGVVGALDEQRGRRDRRRVGLEAPGAERRDRATRRTSRGRRRPGRRGGGPCARAARPPRTSRASRGSARA